MTANTTDTLPVLRVTADTSRRLEDTVVAEVPLTIIFNNHELVTLLCSPQHLDYLAVGYLTSEGLLKRKEEIKRLLVDEQRGVVRINTTNEKEKDPDLIFKRLITSGCGRGVSIYSAGDMPTARVDSTITSSPPEISALMKRFQQQCTIFRATGGTHAAALCDQKDILVFHEDIGRHNAIDKVLGQCLLEDIATTDRILLTSGRVSSEVVLKAARRNIPLLISKSAPTSLAVKLADDLGITLIGFVRGQRMNLYANEWRVIINERQGN